jgi:hypothetical protein
MDKAREAMATHFLDLAGHARVEGFVEFEDAAGDLPLAGVASLDDQGAATVVGHYCGDADGVAGVLVLSHRSLSSNRQMAAVASSYRL